MDIVLLDLKLPVPGLEALRRINRQHPNVEIIVMSSQSEVDLAVQAIKCGARDFIAKPFSLGELKLPLEKVAADLRQKTENRACDHPR